MELQVIDHHVELYANNLVQCMETYPISIYEVISMAQIYHEYQYEKRDTTIDKATLNMHYPNCNDQLPQNHVEAVKT